MHGYLHTRKKIYPCVKRSTPELVVGFVKQRLVVFYKEIPEANPRLSHSIILFAYMHLTLT